MGERGGKSNLYRMACLGLQKGGTRQEVLRCGWVTEVNDMEGKEIHTERKSQTGERKETGDLY